MIVQLGTKTLLIAAIVMLLPNPTFPQEPEPKPRDKKEKKKEPAVTELRIEVVLGEASAPVQNEDVIVSSEAEDATFSESRLPTNSRGVVTLSRVPRGRLLIQIFAKGCKKFGRRYELKQEKETIRIVLEKLPDENG